MNRKILLTQNILPVKDTHITARPTTPCLWTTHLYFLAVIRCCFPIEKSNILLSQKIESFIFPYRLGQANKVFTFIFIGLISVKISKRHHRKEVHLNAEWEASWFSPKEKWAVWGIPEATTLLPTDELCSKPISSGKALLSALLIPRLL